MEPNNCSIYEENKKYFQIFEIQRSNRIDKFIRRVRRISSEIKREFARSKEPITDHQEQLRYYQRKLALIDKFQGNIMSDLKLAEIQEKWPGKPNKGKSLI